MPEPGRRAFALRGLQRLSHLRFERYFDFACALADRYIVTERGEVVLSGNARDMVESDVRRYLTI